MKRRRLLSLLAGAAMAPHLSLSARAQPAGVCNGPAVLDDGWPVAGHDRHVDRDALCRMADRLGGGSANIHAVVVVHGGSLVFERYFGGLDEVPGHFYGRRVEDVTFGPDTLHDMKSVSKSVASLVVGIAIDRGLISGVDEPIFSFFPELSDLRSPEKDRIRLSHVLDMSMGLAWVEATPATGNFDNDEARMNLAWDPCRYVLGRPVTAPAGQDFFYNTGALRLVSAIIRKATGVALDDFARSALFEPLGITGAVWERVRGETDAGGGLRLRPRDMARIGQLVLAGGRWNDRQIVSRNWLATSTEARRKAVDNMSYGFLWWLGDARLQGRDVRWIGALGRGGQSIRIVPELDLVVAVTAGYYQDYSPRAFQTQYGVFRDVLRAMSPPG
jgi:CubicO group peptidase (beta-lactamase class C family)